MFIGYLLPNLDVKTTFVLSGGREQTFSSRSIQYNEIVIKKEKEKEKEKEKIIVEWMIALNILYI